MPQHTVYELRTYTLRPGQRDVLIDLFERHFVESQEAAGMRIVATFRDLDRPDRFVWIRSFASMAARAPALEAFYSGPVWAAHSAAANATMIDSDNVLLLRPAGPAPAPGSARPPVGAPTIPETLFVATIYPLRAPKQEDPFAAFFARRIGPAWQHAGAAIVAAFRTEHSDNDFPLLPVREGETVFVSLMRFATQEAYDGARAAVEASPDWRGQVDPQLRTFLAGPAETLRLQPTARSTLR